MIEQGPHAGGLTAAGGHEQAAKLGRIRALLRDRRLDALVLRRVSSFAWATCGASSHVNTAVDMGEAALLFTPSGRYVVTNSIEAPRLEREEGLKALGWEFLVSDWFDAGGLPGWISKHTQGLRAGIDVCPGSLDMCDLSEEVSLLRSRLLPEETLRFRNLGTLCAEAMSAAASRVRPGQTEHEIAALLAYEALTRGVSPIVNLVATDERVFDIRHPLPTGRRLSRHAMLVLCGRKAGLVCSITRLLHFGPLPDEVRRRQEAVARVDAILVTETRPGAVLGAIFQQAVQAYGEVGYPDEWRRHHQGGAAGYEPREYLGTLTATEVVQEGQAFAWNPSISGVKSEDTILVGSDGNEVLTQIKDWPSLSVEMPHTGHTVNRPAILEVR